MEEIIGICREIAELCQNNDELDWAEVFYSFVEDLKHNEWNTIKRKILNVYAGMGSFNDLILHKNNKPLGKENEELRKLRADLYEKITSNF